MKIVILWIFIGSCLSSNQFYAELARKAMHQLYEIGNLLPQKFNFIACDGKIYDRIYFLENYIFKGLPKDRSVPTSGGNETQLLFIQDSIFVRLGFVIDRIGEKFIITIAYEKARYGRLCNEVYAIFGNKTIMDTL